MALSVVPLSAVVSVRDEDHAISILREAQTQVDEDELRRLARQAVEGELLLVRDAAHEELDDIDNAATAPLLSEFTLA